MLLEYGMNGFVGLQRSGLRRCVDYVWRSCLCCNARARSQTGVNCAMHSNGNILCACLSVGGSMMMMMTMMCVYWMFMRIWQSLTVFGIANATAIKANEKKER